MGTSCLMSCFTSQPLPCFGCCVFCFGWSCFVLVLFIRGVVVGIFFLLSFSRDMTATVLSNAALEKKTSPTGNGAYPGVYQITTTNREVSPSLRGRALPVFFLARCCLGGSQAERPSVSCTKVTARSQGRAISCNQT